MSRCASPANDVCRDHIRRSQDLDPAAARCSSVTFGIPNDRKNRTFALDKLHGRGLASQRASALSIRGPGTGRRTPGEGEFPPAFESDERFFETREGDGGRRWRAR